MCILLNPSKWVNCLVFEHGLLQALISCVLAISGWPVCVPRACEAARDEAFGAEW